jgi:hypothetical protein
MALSTYYYPPPLSRSLINFSLSARSPGLTCQFTD